MDFTALKTAIQNAVKLNGNEEITGDILQGVLLSMVSTLGDSAINNLVTAISNEATARQNGDSTLNGYIEALQGAVNSINTAIENGFVYAGIATPSSTPATGKVFYIALTAGTYTNFGNTEVSQGINILKYDGSDWSLDMVIGLDDTPTPSSTNLVKSGGVFDKVMTDGSAFDISAHFASGGTLATYADLSAALTAFNTLSASYKKGGMSVKFVQSSNNNYIQARLMANEFTTDVTKWQGVDDKPTAGSKNLVESGGVKEYVDKATENIDKIDFSLKSSFINTPIEDNVAVSFPNSGYINKTTGAFVSEGPFVTSDFISINEIKDIEGLEIVTCGNIGIAPIAYYSSNNDSSYIGYQGINNNDTVQRTTTIEIPATAQYFRLCKGTLNTDVCKLQYSYNEFTDFVKPNSNEIIKINVPEYETNGFINKSNTFVEHNAWKSSKYIKIDNRYDYYLKAETQNNSVGYPYFYDSSKNYLGYQEDLTTNMLHITPPIGASYIRISWQGKLTMYRKGKSKVNLVIPIYGQSNALGWHATPSIHIYNKNDKILNEFFGLWKENTIASELWGVCETSATGTAEYILNNFEGINRIIPLVIGTGGTGISNFVKGTGNYNKVIRSISQIKEVSDLLGEDVLVPCFCYIQGEHEVLHDADYKSLLSQMQIDFNTDISALTGQDEIVKCCLYNSSWLEGAAENLPYDSTYMRVCTWQMELVRDNDNFIMSSPTYCCGYNPNDMVHLSNIGEYLLGSYQGISIVKSLNDIKHFGVIPTNIDIQNNVITITVSVPTPPLKVNTELLSAIDFYGFSVINSQNEDILQSVSVDGVNNQIVLTCSESPSGCKLRYGANGTVSESFTNGPRGNISDSNGMKQCVEVLGNIYRLDNYLCFFEELL